MNLIAVLLLIIASTIIILLAITVPVTKDLGKCFDQANNTMATLGEKAANEKWGKEKICLEGKTMVESIISCYQNVSQGKGVQRTNLTWQLTKIFNPNTTNLTENELKKLQNESCGQFPASLLPE